MTQISESGLSFSFLDNVDVKNLTIPSFIGAIITICPIVKG